MLASLRMQEGGRAGVGGWPVLRSTSLGWTGAVRQSESGRVAPDLGLGWSTGILIAGEF